MDDDLERLFEEQGIEYFEHYSYEDEQPLEPYDGVDDYTDALSPATTIILWALAAIVFGIILLI